MKFHYNNIPFTLSDTYELEKINMSDSMQIFDHLPSLETIYETKKLATFKVTNSDEEGTLPTLVNSKYYDINEFQKLKIQKNINVLHVGLKSKTRIVKTLSVVAYTDTPEKTTRNWKSSYPT